MKTGRAFFIDWTEPHGGWQVGLSLPASTSNWLDSSGSWNWDWHAAACKQAWTARAITDTRTIAHVFGAVTAEHWILDEVQPVADAWARRHADLLPHAMESPAAAKFAFEYIVSRRFHIAGRLLRPSAEVLEVCVVFCMDWLVCCKRLY